MRFDADGCFVGEVMGEKEAREILDKAPHFTKWHESLMARPAVRSVMTNPDLNARY